MLCRYLECGSNALDDEIMQKKLESTALSCILNTAACKLKLQQWQEAIESCDEVHTLSGTRRLVLEAHATSS